jgi:hypothetical protein
MTGKSNTSKKISLMLVEYKNRIGKMENKKGWSGTGNLNRFNQLAVMFVLGTPI